MLSYDKIDLCGDAVPTRTLLSVFSADLDIAKRRALDLEVIKGCLWEDGL